MRIGSDMALGLRYVIGCLLAGCLPALQAQAQTAVVTPHEFDQIAAEGPWRLPRPGALAPSQSVLASLLAQGKGDEALAWLRQAAAPVNWRDEQGRTPLTMAVAQGHMPLVRELLRRGAQPDELGVGGFTPMGLAAYQGDDLMVRELLRSGADPRAVGATGQSPLHLACMAGQSRVVALLLRTPRVDRLQFNQAGRHALAEAAYNGQIATIDQLVAAGVRADEPDQYRLNALHAAAVGRQPEAWRHLQGLGVKVPHVLSEVLMGQALAEPGLLTAP